VHFLGEATISSRGQLVLAAPSHSTLVVKTFLAKYDAVEISHPSYSPDHAPVGFFSFLWRKLPSKEVENIKKNMTAELNTVPLEAFADYFQKCFEQCNKCIKVGGDYFE
jgi:hypothetical protein